MSNPATSRPAGLDNLLGFVAAELSCDEPEHKLWLEVLSARLEAHAKHGPNSIGAIPAGDPRWLPILVEEVGEVAEALTYDKASRPGLRAELVDVLAVASAWIDALDSADDLEPTGTGGHDLVVSLGDCEMHGTCQCGQPLGVIKPDQPLEVLGRAWEHHVMTEVPR